MVHAYNALSYSTCGLMSLTNALPLEAAKAAQLASHLLSTLSTTARNNALTVLHEALSDAKDDILAANARDLISAKKAAESGELSTSIVARLDLGKKGKWEDMMKGILDVRELEDPGKYYYFKAVKAPIVTKVSWKSNAANTFGRRT